MKISTSAFGLCVLLALLATSTGPVCGATLCDAPLRLDTVQQNTATGLAQAQEKFLACTQPSAPRHERQERWRAPSTGPPTARARPHAGSKLKRPLDVGSIVNRRRADEAKQHSTPLSSTSASWSSSRDKHEAPGWGSAMRDAATPPHVSAGRTIQQQQAPGNDAEDDIMLESPILFSSVSKTDSAQRDSLSAQATPACYSQTRPSAFASLRKSEHISAGADTPHLRASDWVSHTPEPITAPRQLSQKLFAQDEHQQPGAVSDAGVQLLSAIKAVQEQQYQYEGLQTQQKPQGDVMLAPVGMSEYEEEACMLLSHAREELQELNSRWKDAEEARILQSRKAAGLRIELEILQEDVAVLEADKVSIYSELKMSQDSNSLLQDDLFAMQQQQREVSQRCTSLMAEKAAAEAKLASFESESLQVSRI